MHRILYPSDFSPASGRVFDRALRFARASQAALLVVHVLTPNTPAVRDQDPADRGPDSVVDRSAHGYAKRQLDRLVAKAHRAHVPASGLLLEGAAADQIIRAAKSNHAHVIVMRAQDTNGLARFFLGGVTDRVIAGASCPVLTFRDTRRSRRRTHREQLLGAP